MNTPTSTGSKNSEMPGRVDLQISDGIAWLKVNNTKRYNAMSLSMWRELASHIHTAEQNPDVRVIAVTGVNDRAFVSGADITEFATLRDSKEQIDAYEQAVSDAQSALIACNKPSIALIQGICMGGGIGIALSCDLRITSANTRFRMPAARLGLGYDIAGMKRSVQVMGYANTADIFFSARTFDGTEALRLGLVNRCFKVEHFDLQVNAVMADLVTNAPLTLKAAKLALRHILCNVDEPVENVEFAISQCFSSDDYREGQKAFSEKRKPEFQGR